MALRESRALLALIIALAVPAPSLATATQRPSPAPAVAAPAADPRLAAVEKAIDEKRKELGIPGASLVIVKDDKVIYVKGLGYKNFEDKLPVTPDTLFAIGSSTKAFTALTVMMSVDEGKLSLEDSPKKYLPFFKLQDPEADAKITIRNLLSHNSGLNRTDLPMITGKLTRAEIIEVASHAKPTAKLGEKFQYQNVMFAAAGEIVARIHDTTWERFVADRVLAPLGMSSSTLTIDRMQASKDFSFGYEYNFGTKATRRLPFRGIAEVAPAGAINSSARDMAQWLRFMLAGGAVDGKRLVSEKSFDQLVTKQMTVGGPVGYGFGWFLRDWNGHKVVEHGGNIDGFNAQVALMPDQKLGFVLLTNVTGSSLPETAMEAVWANLVGDGSATAATAPAAGGSVDAKSEVGRYVFAQANLTLEIELRDGKLWMTGAPGQPPYPLENLSGRRYKLGASAPAGFFATFRPAAGTPGASELYLEQPQGAIALLKSTAADAPAVDTRAAAELVGTYGDAKGVEKMTMDIAVKDGKASLVVAGQPPYALIPKGKDVYQLAALPPSFELTVRRDAAGAATGFELKQPQGTIELKRTAEYKAPITIDELMAKVIAAQGGEASVRKHKTMVATVDIDFASQGMNATGTVASRAPDAMASDVKLLALGKDVGWIHEYFDGKIGGSQTSFSPAEIKAGKSLEEARIGSAFYGLLDWKTLFKSASIKRSEKVGDEECYVVELVPPTSNPVTLWVSASTSRVLRRDSLSSSETSGQSIPTTESYDDFRVIDGVLVPFRTVQQTLGMGEIVVTLKDVRFDVPVSERLFSAR